MKAKEQKRKEWKAFLAELKSLPPEKLSKTAKYWLARENEPAVEYDMRAVLR